MTSNQWTSAPWWIAAAFVSIAFGFGIVVNRQVTFLALVALLGVAAAASPASTWVAAALVAALTFKGLVSLGVLPSVATFIDIPLAWGAFFVALLKQRNRPAFLRRQLRWLALLTLGVFLAWAFNPSEVLRPILYLMLLGEPFVIAAALVADPPSPRMRRTLELLLLALVLVQIPIAALQLTTSGSGDYIQGTLYKAGAGAHVISGVVVVGAIWILAGGTPSRMLGVWRYPLAALLFVIPFVADAKQVILALPAIVLASSWQRNRFQLVARSFLAVACIIALFTLAPAGRTAEHYIENAQHGHTGKLGVGKFVWDKLRTDPAAIVFGKGPAETVSRAAFLTTPEFETSRSALSALDLKPASIALEAKGAAAQAGGTGTSFNSGVSSTLGVFGDLGIFGLSAYVGLLVSLFLGLRREVSPEGKAAAAGFALFMVLGLVFDWWEQPPFGVVLGVLAGLALTASPNQFGSQVPAPDEPA